MVCVNCPTHKSIPSTCWRGNCNFLWSQGLPGQNHRASILCRSHDLSCHIFSTTGTAILWCLRATVSAVLLLMLGNSWIMVLCAAYVCNNMTDRNLSDKRTFYTIPNPNIHPEKRNLAAQWLHKIGTGWSVRNFKVASYLKEYVRTTLRHPASWMICRQD